ncbi:MAG: hypothetical protein R2712_21335 [Vicinamibacterales bacterium]
MGLLGRTCAWEEAYFRATGRAAEASRRRARGPVAVPVCGLDVPTFYHSVADVGAVLGPGFRRDARLGLAVLVPPPYLEARWRRLPRVVRTVVAAVDRGIAAWPPANRLGDHVLVRWSRQRYADG